jgi:hypothetical protein
VTTSFPHEAWCPSCLVTHPPGTRRCLHCGGPVSPERPAEGSAAPAPLARPGSASPWPPQAGDDEQAADPARAVRPMKIAMAGLWIVLAIVTGILRSCTEGG